MPINLGRVAKKSFDQKDTDDSGFLDRDEMAAALASSGIIASPVCI